MSDSLFREKALERLSSPEQLDQLMRVTSPRSWLAMLGVLFLVGVIVVWGVFGTIPSTTTGQGILIRGGIDNISAPVTGLVDDIYIGVGDIIEEGQIVARIQRQDSDEAVEIRSPSNGTVVELRVATNEFIEIGDPLINIEPSGEEMGVLLFLPAVDGKNVQPGMKVHIEPSTVRAEEVGVVLGWVVSVGEFPESQESMRRTLENDDLVEFFFESTSRAPIQVTVDLIPSRETASGYKWSSPGGEDVELQSGTLLEATIILEEQSPVKLIFPFVN